MLAFAILTRIAGRVTMLAVYVRGEEGLFVFEDARLERLETARSISSGWDRGITRLLQAKAREIR